MSKLTQGELLNNAFKEAIHREEQRQARYAYLSKRIKDSRLKKIYARFAEASSDHLTRLKAEVKHFNIKIK